jgi:hypothetical protein
MDNSTDNVTLLSGFIFDVLHEYRSMERMCRPLFEMTRGLDASQPLARAPISLYNQVCQWVQDNLGQASIRDAGRAIGARAYDQMVKDGTLGTAPTPNQILRELKRVADIMIQDPRKRGWTILEDEPRRMVLRRTQTFNCVLQEGLLLSLVERTGSLMPSVRHAKCTQAGAEFCEYEVTWMSRARKK